MSESIKTCSLCGKELDGEEHLCGGTGPLVAGPSVEAGSAFGRRLPGRLPGLSGSTRGALTVLPFTALVLVVLAALTADFIAPGAASPTPQSTHLAALPTPSPTPAAASFVLPTQAAPTSPPASASAAPTPTSKPTAKPTAKKTAWPNPSQQADPCVVSGQAAIGSSGSSARALASSSSGTQPPIQPGHFQLIGALPSEFVMPDAVTATVLPNGRVFLFGGSRDGAAYLFDPATNRFVLTGAADSVEGALDPGREGARPVLLPSGKVLVDAIVNIARGGCAEIASSKLFVYDPSGGRFIAAAGTTPNGPDAGITLLASGKVLFVGGDGTAQVYDPVSGGVTPTGPMISGRSGATGTLLPNGTVLFAGGFAGDGVSHLASAELYRPSGNDFVAVSASMTQPRFAATATVLPDGRILIAGGDTPTAELYDPATGTFTATGTMATSRTSAAARLLPDGRVLVVGGGAEGSPVAEVFDPATGTFSTTAGQLPGPANYATATLLHNGLVLVIADGKAYLYQP